LGAQVQACVDQQLKKGGGNKKKKKKVKLRIPTTHRKGGETKRGLKLSKCLKWGQFKKTPGGIWETYQSTQEKIRGGGGG